MMTTILNPALETKSFLYRLRWTRRFALFIGLLGTVAQAALGLSLWFVEPPPPPGFASFGLAVTLGSVIAGAGFAVTGAAMGAIVDGVSVILSKSKS